MFSTPSKSFILLQQSFITGSSLPVVYVLFIAFCELLFIVPVCIFFSSLQIHIGIIGKKGCTLCKQINDFYLIHKFSLNRWLILIHLIWFISSVLWIGLQRRFCSVMMIKSYIWLAKIWMIMRWQQGVKLLYLCCSLMAVQIFRPDIVNLHSGTDSLNTNSYSAYPSLSFFMASLFLSCPPDSNVLRSNILYKLREHLTDLWGF